jgi:hypothetical protein
MTPPREGPLAKIEAGIFDDKPLSSLLTMCIVLGGRAGSESFQSWARQELNGYVGVGKAIKLPEYRTIGAPFFAWVTNYAGFNGFRQQLFRGELPESLQEFDCDTLHLVQGIGELEGFPASDDSIRLQPSQVGAIVRALNDANQAYQSQVESVFWEVGSGAIQGVLVRIRAALADLVSELITATPASQDVPDKAVADHAVLMITGNQNVVNYSPQIASDGGQNNVTVGSPDTPDEPAGRRARKRG